MNDRLKNIAAHVAQMARVSGFADFGAFYSEEWNLTDDEWSAVVAKAQRLAPRVTVTRADKIAWSRSRVSDRALRHAEGGYQA